MYTVIYIGYQYLYVTYIIQRVLVVFWNGGYLYDQLGTWKFPVFDLRMDQKRSAAKRRQWIYAAQVQHVLTNQ